VNAAHIYAMINSHGNRSTHSSNAQQKNAECFQHR